MREAMRAPAAGRTCRTGVAGTVTMPTHAELQLRRLVRLAALRDIEAFADLYDATSAEVFGVVREVVGSAAVAVAVTSQCYDVVWRSAGRFDPARGTVLAWIVGIAHRLAVDQVRSTRRGRGHTVWGDDSGAVRGQASDSTDDSVLRGLSNVQRRALRLAYREGWTYREVALVLGVSPAHAAAILRSGLIRLTRPNRNASPAPNCPPDERINDPRD